MSGIRSIPWMMVALSVAILAQILDLVTFLLAVGVYGIQGEANPVVRLVYEQFGIVGVLVLKIELLVYFVFLMWYLKFIKKIAIAAVMAAGLLGSASNILVLSWAL